jgi:tRNA threonylcarbamoyl adenosine modification protein YjeE
MKLILKKNIPNQEASKQFAQAFYNDFLASEPSFTVFFEGGLGAGKTFLIREMLRVAGVKDEISSPTYIFLNEYTSPIKSGTTRFAHFDFYRFKDPAEFFARGFSETAEDRNVCKFVEWPEKISNEAEKSFSGKRYTIIIKHGVGVGMREVRVISDD